MESNYIAPTYHSFDDITFSIGTVPVGKMTIAVAKFRRGDTIAACRISCPHRTSDPKAWLTARLRLALEDRLTLCHDDECCPACVRSIKNIHAHLSNWLPPVQHGKFLEKVAKHP